MSIYTPYIIDTVPAFLEDGEVSINFNDNPAVGSSTNLKAKVLELNSGVTLQVVENIFVQQNDNGTRTAIVKFDKVKFTPWVFYKFQLAYEGEDSVWSSVAVGRCVKELTSLNVEATGSLITATAQLATLSEPIYSYYFTVKKGNAEEDLGIKYIPSNGQNADDSFALASYNVQDMSISEIKITVITFNGYTQATDFVEVARNEGSKQLVTSIKAAINETDGIVKVAITPSSKGSYQLLRSIDQKSFDILTTFAIDDKQIVIEDCAVEHGMIYYYTVRETDGTMHNEWSEGIEVYFEDLFLSDGERQLCVRFNPGVSSFKDTILESKQDTIGGKYPFFFRNGDVRYKEIPISGLLSYQLDENQKFISDKELGLEIESEQIRQNTPAQVIDTKKQRLRTTSLAHYNIAAERRFKLAALEWLNNGKPKLFRSPTEGNYIVRLMNVNLQPEEKLGRMLHSFSATGYECANCTVEELKNNNILIAYQGN